MKKEVISYISEEALSGTSQLAAPKLTCKFVCIARKDTLCFVMGLVSEFPYHAYLVDRFCNERGIPALWVKVPDIVDVYSPDTLVRGGGNLEIDTSEQTITISGFSKAYGPFVLADLEGLVANQLFFASYSVSIVDPLSERK